MSNKSGSTCYIYYAYWEQWIWSLPSWRTTITWSRFTCDFSSWILHDTNNFVFFFQSVFLYATIASTLCNNVVNDRNRTSSEFAINCGPSSSHESGTSRSLSVYTSRSNAPTNIRRKWVNYCWITSEQSQTDQLFFVLVSLVFELFLSTL